MDDSPAQVDPSSRRRVLARQTLSWFASLKLAVLLMVGLAAVLATAIDVTALYVLGRV